MDIVSKMTTFVRVVERGSLAAAAKHLGVSSGAVSRQIAALEDDVGVALLARTTRRMALTDAGRLYYERCLRVLREVDEARAVGKHGGVEGPLRMSVPVTFGLAAIAPLMPALLRRYPSLVLDMQLEDRFVDLLPEGIDLAIRTGRPPVSNDLIASELVRYGRTLVASPRYLQEHGTPHTPEALARHDALLPSGATSWTFTAKESVTVRPRIAFRSNSLHVLRELAIEGAGLALLPAWFVRAVRPNRLRRLLPTWRAPSITVWAVYRTEHRGSARVRAVVEHMRAGVQRLAS